MKRLLQHPRRPNYRLFHSITEPSGGEGRTRSVSLAHARFSSLNGPFPPQKWTRAAPQAWRAPINSISGRYFSDKIKNDTKSSSEKPKDSSEGSAEPSSFDPKEHLHQNLANSPIVNQMNQRIQRVVHGLNVGDQLSVVAIITLISLLLASPYIISGIQNSESDFDEQMAITEDPVDDFAKLARHGWSNLEDMSKDPLELVLKEILQNQPIQDAARRFAVQVLESPDVQHALGRLVKQLWTQLVTDPETLAQVVHLLESAIQDEKVRKAAQKLLVELVQDPQVKESLLNLVRELGNDELVSKSVQDLLTNSAHSSMNDPEILEHTMEFASDIVGDDLVQRTARDALWNTVGDAVRPATTILLTTIGVGLVLFGIISLGYARSSDREAAVLSSAAKSIQHHATHGILRFCSWPLRKLQSIGLGRHFESVCEYLTTQPVIWVTSLQNLVLHGLGLRRPRGQPPVPRGFGNYESVWETTTRWSQGSVLAVWSGLVGTANFLVSHSLQGARALLGQMKSTTQMLEGIVGDLCQIALKAGLEAVHVGLNYVKISVRAIGSAAILQVSLVGSWIGRWWKSERSSPVS